MVRGRHPLLHLTVRSSYTSSSTAQILVATSLIAPSMAADKSNLSSFLIFGKQPRRGNPNRCPCHTTSLAHAEPILGFNQVEQHKQWPLPHHLLGPCQVDSLPLPADVPHHPNGCPVAASPKKKTRRIKFFLHRCGAKKTKKSTEDGSVHGQANKSARGGETNIL
ncbi:hypothetical protein ACFX2K_013576 [Malus domestica]